MGVKRKKTDPTVCIVESLGFLEEQNHREGEIIARTLQLSNKPAPYAYVRTRAELEAFIEEFAESRHRYLHISCHGNRSGLYTTIDELPAVEFARQIAPYVAKRRVFLSTCQGADSRFALELMHSSECWSVLAPVGEIHFNDAAIFWTAFYHLMFKKNADSMRLSDIESNVAICANLVGQDFRLFYRAGKLVAQKSLGPGGVRKGKSV